ncbi:putative acetyltransferase [Escherichia coli]|uniref:Putative acetyltransferase n=1 Tax=Escherichia coli TaxID=562 RepID=A0A376L4S1_ECOLX|nr:putative acetyltransferase [Escherichia coli]
MRFRVGFNANLRAPNMRYHLALLDGEVVGMIACICSFICIMSTGSAKFRNWW